MQRADSLEKTPMLGKIEGRGWDGWMASWSQWTWVWANLGRWWRTEQPDMLQSMGLQKSDTTWWLNNNNLWDFSTSTSVALFRRGGNAAYQGCFQVLNKSQVKASPLEFLGVCVPNGVDLTVFQCGINNVKKQHFIMGMIFKILRYISFVKWKPAGQTPDAGPCVRELSQKGQFPWRPTAPRALGSVPWRAVRAARRAWPPGWSFTRCVWRGRSKCHKAGWVLENNIH